jgi:two-component system OmpR family response regulator
MKTILILDDDRDIRDLLADYLGRHGFRTFTLPDGRGLWRQLDEHTIDLIVLDLMMPGTDGLTLCRSLRERKSTVPVLMLSARGEDVDRIVGLESGADDYLPKPFHPRELVARVKAILKRTEREDRVPDAALYRFEGNTLDTVRRVLVRGDGREVALSGAEFELLEIFLARPNRVLSRDLLVELTQGREAPAYDRSIDVRVSRLRAALGEGTKDAKYVKTVYGEGYVLAARVERIEAGAGAPN